MFSTLYMTDLINTAKVVLKVLQYFIMVSRYTLIIFCRKKCHFLKYRIKLIIKSSDGLKVPYGTWPEKHKRVQWVKAPAV